MLSKTNYREPAFKIFIPIAGTCALIGNAVILYSLFLSNFEISFVECFMYALASSIFFAFNLSCTNNSNLLIRGSQTNKQEAIPIISGFTGIFWILINAIALGYFFLGEGESLKGFTFLITTTLSFLLFNYAFGHSIQSFFKKAHNAEKLARNKKRLQVAYEKYVKLSTRNTKDHKFFEQALHSNKLLEVVRAIRLFEAKCIRKNYKL